MPSSAVLRLRYELDNGMNVIVGGYISVYEKGGYYSLNIRELEAEGRGALAIAFDKVKEKLEKEGVFSLEHKKKIPSFAMKIAIVTSPTGAALQDMLKIIKSRNDVTDVLIYPSAVQGDGAALQIASAIDAINREHPDVEIIIAGRGGGSQEDLWAFNEECVARAIFNSKIPVISAVGHETDFTIADFVADKRAPTPSAAAELCTFRYEDLERELSAVRDRLDSAIQRKLEGKRRALYNRRLRLLPHDPASVLKERRLRLRQLESGYEKALRLRLRDAKARKEAFAFDIYSAVRSKLTASRHGLELRAGRLDASSPLRRISGGYGYITGEDGKAIRSISEVQEGGTVRTRLRDGSFTSTVDAVERPERKINSKAERSYEKD